MFTSIVTGVLRWVTGDLAGRLGEAYRASKNAQTESERMAYEAEARRLEAMIRVRTNGGRLFDWVAVLIAMPFIIHLWAVGIDTTFTNIDWGIPAFPAPFDEWEGRVLLSFFGLTAVARLVRR